MEPPPAALYQRNPTAFHLYADLLERPRDTVRLADVIQLTGVKETAARAAIYELVALGVLAPVVQGRYRPANAPEPSADTPSAKRCRHCLRVLTPPRRKYCNDACSQAFHSKLRTVRANSRTSPQER